MKTRILGARDVRALLPMAVCIDVMAKTLEAATGGEVVNPLRTALRFPDGSGLIGMMPAYLGNPKSTGIKVVTVMPGNHATEFDSHQGAVLLHEVENGRLLAMIDASSVTAIRTAAVSGLATRLLAREDATTLAILGSGAQAKTHLEAMREVRRISNVRVWSRSSDSAAAFAARESKRYNLPVDVTSSAREAVDGADIICTTTAAQEPVLFGEWVSPGAHINAVGACLREFRELDTEVVVRSRLFIDWRESTLNEAGDFLIPKSEGAIGDDHIVGEIGELLLGRIEGRRDREEITLFKSLGIGIEDLGAAQYLYQQALEKNVGVDVEFGETRHEAD